MKLKCFICKKQTQGRGNFEFNYRERIYLCGHHAQKVMNFIKQEEKENE